MTITEANITAESYFNHNGIYYVKVAFEGMYISGITVQKSKKYEGWWVQMPAYQKNGKWKKYIEYANDSPLKALIESKAIEAVEGNRILDLDDTAPSDDVVVESTDKQMENPGALFDDIPDF